MLAREEQAARDLEIVWLPGRAPELGAEPTRPAEGETLPEEGEE